MDLQARRVLRGRHVKADPSSPSVTLLHPVRDASGRPKTCLSYVVAIGDLYVRFSSLSREDAVAHAQAIHKREGTVPDVHEIERTPIDHGRTERMSMTSPAVEDD